jgi:hypothetical protein
MHNGKEIAKEIEKIIGNMDCPRGFACYKKQCKPFCEITNSGINNHLEVTGKQQLCQFSISYGDKHYCRCPLHVYLRKIHEPK